MTQHAKKVRQPVDSTFQSATLRKIDRYPVQHWGEITESDVQIIHGLKNE